MTHAEVPLDSETHGGDDVGVFARGPQHGMFSGLYEQSQLPHLMAYAACLGPGAHAPACAADAGSETGTEEAMAVAIDTTAGPTTAPGDDCGDPDDPDCSAATAPGAAPLLAFFAFITVLRVVL